MRTKIYELKNYMISAEILNDELTKIEIHEKINEWREQIKEIVKLYVKNYSNKEASIKNTFNKVMEENQIKGEVIKVKNIREAINKIEEIDFRKYLGLNVMINEPFDLDININAKIISFVAFNEEEIKNQIDELKHKYRNNIIDILKIGYNEWFKNYTCDLLVYRKNSEKVWIGKEENKFYLYIMDNERSHKYKAKFNLIDLYEIYFDADKSSAIFDICDKLGIKVEIYEKEKIKIEKNKKFLEENINRYPNLNKLTKKYIKDIIRFHDLYYENIKYIKEYNGEIIFSVSLDYIGNKLNRKKSTLSPIMNVLNILGFINKIEVVDSDKVKKISNYNDITHYYIPEYTNNLFLRADEIAKKFIDNGVTVSLYTHKLYKEIINENIEEVV